MDRNTVTGFALLALLLIGYVSWNSYNKSQFDKANQHFQDSIARTQPRRADSMKLVTPGNIATTGTDTLSDSARMALPPAFSGTATTIKLENKNLSLSFSTKGAYPVSAQLKDYKTYKGQPLYFFNGPSNKLSATLPGGGGAPVATEDLFFTATQQGPQAVSFTADMGSGRAATLAYSLPAEGYMLNCKLSFAGMAMPAGLVPMRWQALALHTERDVSTERLASQVYYSYKNDDHDYYTLKSGNENKDLGEGNMHWVGLRQHYFSSALIADDNGFAATKIAATSALADSSVASQASTTFNLPLKADGSASLRWYIGPNQYSTLKSYHIGLDEMVPLGFGPFFFVKYINKWLIIPVFNFLHGTLGIMNMGIIIMLLTIFIRLLLSFFTYKSYLSAAKMRVLKPELDELRKVHGDDQKAMGVEQMKMYRSAGVNPLGGCLPTLFQIPILFAMYYFFPSAIELRQKSFLWAHDLSTYDSIAQLPFNIPFYGDHVSLFTILMTASSLFLAVYNRNMTAGQDMNNPMLKYMPFVFPVLLMGVFNKMAAALTFYYFFSNMLSITQQFIIQKFIIDEKKIHAKIQENRSKPATPGKWAAKMEEMQKAQLDRGRQRTIRK